MNKKQRKLLNKIYVNAMMSMMHLQLLEQGVPESRKVCEKEFDRLSEIRRLVNEIEVIERDKEEKKKRAKGKKA